jgi:hypothetical protein
LVLFLTQVALPQESETTLRLALRQPAGVVGAKEGGVAPATIDVTAGTATVAVGVSMFLDTAIAACLPPNPPCDGGENFFDSKNFVYGCADMLDNDSNGVSDAADPDCNGVQGWSMSVVTAPCFNIRSTTVGAPANRGATTVGTLGDLNTNPPGLRDPSGSFEKTERVDPANPANSGRQGAVSAVVLAFTNPVILPQVSTANEVLRLNGDMSASALQNPGDMTEPCLLSVVSPTAEMGPDGPLSGSGEPVQTAVTVSGETAIPDLCDLSIKLQIPSAPPEDCDDGVDNDSDGLTDGDDPDCQENCTDGIDNDGDGLTDREDLVDCPPGCDDPVAREVALRLVLTSPPGVEMSSIPPGCPDKTSNVVAEVAAGGTSPTPVKVAVNLVSRLAACMSPNPPCTGGENFFDGENFVYGCADMVDNDSNGVSDAADPDCNGVQGWSFSVVTGTCFAIRSTTAGAPANRGATTIGTVGDLNTNPPGLRDPSGSFEKTERVDPANPANNGRQGAVSAVVLAFTNPVILDQVSEETVCILNGDLNTSALTGPGTMTSACAVSLVSPTAEMGPDGPLSGSGEPVQTAVTVAGETANPNLCQLSFKLAVPDVAVENQFIRCDPNDDGRNDIADSVWIINELFRSGPESRCEKAADCNDDNMVDQSDALYGINYQFMNGPTPAPPFASCGLDPTASPAVDPPLTCENASRRCDV